jgi:hypothetical protein
MLKATARGAKAEEVTVPFEVGAPKIQVFAAKSTVHDGITNGIKENDGLDITDLDRGHNITITKTGTTQFDTKYAVTIMIAPSKCIVNESNCNLNELDKVNPPLEANKVTELLGSGKAQAARAVLGSGAPKVRGSLAADSKAAARGVDPAEAKRVAKEAFRGSPVEEEEGDSDDIDLEGLERELRGE